MDLMKTDKMGKDEKKEKIELKTFMQSAAVAEYLTQLAKGFQAGCIVVEKDGQKLVLTPAENAEVEVEARIKKDKAKFALEVSWRISSGEPQALTISDKAKAAKLEISGGKEADKKAEAKKQDKKQEKKPEPKKSEGKKPATKQAAPAKKAVAQKPESVKPAPGATAVKPAAPAAPVAPGLAKPAAPAAPAAPGLAKPAAPAAPAAPGIAKPEPK